MKQKRLVFAIATALAGSPMLANSAPVEMGAGAGSSGATVWAKELKRDDAGAYIMTGSGDLLTLDVFVGFGFPETFSRYLRLDLQGAKFKTMPLCEVGHTANGGAAGNFDGSGGELGLELPTGTVCSPRTGGGAGTSFAKFKLDASGGDVPANGIVRFYFSTDTDGITPGNTSKVSVRYSIHNNDVSADTTNQSTAGGVLYEKTGDYVVFEPVINVQASPRPALTADVSKEFLSFVEGAHGSIGQFSYPDPASFTNTIYTVDDIGTPADAVAAAVSNIISASSLTVSGDFTSVQDFSGTTGLGTYSSAGSRVFLSVDSTSPTDVCGSTTAVAAQTVTAGSAVFNLGTAHVGDDVHVCIKPNGVTPIAPSTYNMAFSFTPNTGYEIANYTFDAAGSIRQNGTVLDTPYLTVNTGYISRVILTNTGTKEAPYIATVVTDSGATATAGSAATGSIPAGANLQINASDLVSFSGKPRGAVRFVVTAPNQTIQAVYQTVNLASGDVQSVLLNRRGGGDGQQ